MTEPDFRPLAAPRGESPRTADPATLIGWLLLAFAGVAALRAYLLWREVATGVLGLLCLGVLAGFVHAHRYRGSVFSVLWFGFFSGAMAVAGLVAHVATMLR